ncbi:MAG: hypothetical protein P1R58_01375, partial [bacterium]|nr:hypothetical protein [bacterium]
ETTELVKSATIEPTESEIKLVPGDGDVAIITTGRRGKTHHVGTQYALAFDQHLRVKLFLELPTKLEKARFPVLDNSGAQLLGNYEMPAEQKVYAPITGEFSVDSLTSTMLFLTVDASFESVTSDTIKLDGQFKMRFRD